MSRSDFMMLLALGLVFTPLEWLWPIRRAPNDWPRLRTDVLHIFISGTVIRLSVSTIVAGIGLLVSHVLPATLSPAIRSQPGWLQFVEILLIAEFAFYGYHRLSHAVPTLWRFHAVHHSSEKLDWIAGNRVHPVDQILLATTYTAVPLLLGFSPEPLLVYGFVYRWHVEFLHSNVRINLGPLKWLIASPQYHHWHHADEEEAYDRNFGAQLLIFDWLFGTLNMHGEAMPRKYGLSEPIPRDYLGQMLYPFRRTDRETGATSETSAA